MAGQLPDAPRRMAQPWGGNDVGSTPESSNENYNLMVLVVFPDTTSDQLCIGPYLPHLATVFSLLMMHDGLGPSVGF